MSFIKSLSLFLLSSSWAIGIVAQPNDNPILMHINGKPITRGEFEYAYNKNNSIEGAVEQKTITEYLDMFINYKLKVEAAESFKMDTLASFQEEFRTYRDMQLTPALVNQTFIDSVARSLYNQQAELIGSKDLLTTAHILFTVNQTASEAEKSLVAARADSAYQALMAGADFATLAKAVSQDPGSASQGGSLPTIYPGMTLKEFEEQAYSLQPGQFSRPFLSAVGYHIILMKERKPLDSYEVLYPTIIQALKRQNIEEISAEQHIEKLVAAGKTREEVLDSVLKNRLQEDPDLKYLIQEYYDGLLLYEVAKKTVWDVVAKDEKGLEAVFRRNAKQYGWKQPRFKGFIISAKNKTVAKATQKLLKKGVPMGVALRDYLKSTINKDSLLVVASGEHLVEKGENSTIDHLIFKQKTAKVNPVRPGFDVTVTVGKKLKRPQSFRDVRSQVVADYQQLMEQRWVEELRKFYPFSVDNQVLKTVNNH